MAAIFPYAPTPGIDLTTPLDQTLLTDGNLGDGAFPLEGVPLIESLDSFNELLGDLIPPQPPVDWGREILLYGAYVNGQAPNTIPGSSDYGSWNSRLTGVLSATALLPEIPVSNGIVANGQSTFSGWVYLGGSRQYLIVKHLGVELERINLDAVRNSLLTSVPYTGLNSIVAFDLPVSYIPPTTQSPFSAYKIAKFTVTLDLPQTVRANVGSDITLSLVLEDVANVVLETNAINLVVDEDSPASLMTPVVTAVSSPLNYRSGIPYFKSGDQFTAEFGFSGTFLCTHDTNRVVDVLNGFLGFDFAIPSSAFPNTKDNDNAQLFAYAFQVGSNISYTSDAAIALRGVDGAHNVSAYTPPSTGGPFQIDNLYLDTVTVKNLPLTIDGNNGTLNAYDLFYDESPVATEGVRVTGHLNGARKEDVVSPGTAWDEQLDRTGSTDAQIKFGQLIYPTDYAPVVGPVTYVFESLVLAEDKSNFYLVLDSLNGNVDENLLTIEVQNIAAGGPWTDITLLRQNPLANPARKFTGGRYVFDLAQQVSNHFRLRITIPVGFTGSLEALGIYLV